ncbi:hypothetical protein RP20_CCG018152 [Aedes albopictus]|nr:hypothetical protein RP20_CCG018152 [Aedes albopictus]
MEFFRNPASITRVDLDPAQWPVEESEKHSGVKIRLATRSASWNGTFQVMDPDMGCQCEPSRPLRCPRGARKAEENYINSVFLQSLPEAKRRKVFGDRDPCRDLKMVLISLYILSTRNNARFNTEKTKSGQRHIFDEMH